MFLLHRKEQFMFKEIDKPRLLKATATLCRRFRDMERFPRDRDLQDARCAYIKKAVKAGEFRGAEWVAASCKETGLTYRLNGKHTSHVLSKMYDDGEDVPEIFILVREYECEDLEDVARLYATFDARQSARTKADVVRGFANASPILSEMSSKHLNLLTSALAYNLWGDGYYNKGADEQSMLLLQNADFCLWAHDILRGCGKGERHIWRMSVVAAMVRTWYKAKGASTEFWTMVRDDCDLSRDSGPRKLHKYLITHSVTGKGTPSVVGGKVKVTAKEVMVKCLHAWNAWRRNESTNLNYRADKPVPAVA
jgi:hypothetical protein